MDIGEELLYNRHADMWDQSSNQGSVTNTMYVTIEPSKQLWHQSCVGYLLLDECEFGINDVGTKALYP